MLNYALLTTLGLAFDLGDLQRLFGSDDSRRESMDLDDMDLEEMMGELMDEMDSFDEEAASDEAAAADSPVDFYPADFELTPGGTTSQTIEHEGAEYIKVHLSQEGLAACAGATLVVKDSTGDESHTYDGEDFTEAGCTGDCSKLYAMSVTSDSVVVSLEGADNCPGLSIKVDGYEAEMEDDRRRKEMPESICGTKTAWEDRQCYKTSRPTEYAQSRAMGRFTGRRGLCTAWNIGNGLLLTNAHCCPEQTKCDMTNAEVWYDYEKSTCNGSVNNGNVKKVALGATLYWKMANRVDVALVRLKNPTLAESFGTIKLDPSTPTVNQQIFIAAHPGGGPKKLSIFEDALGGNRCKVSGLNGNQLRYVCDTIGGSSGSPVFKAGTSGNQGTAIAIHAWGGCSSSGGSNAGTMVKAFYNNIKQFLGNTPAPPTPTPPPATTTTTAAPPAPPAGGMVTVTGTFSCGKYFKTTPSSWNAILGSGWKSGVRTMTVYRNGAVVRSGQVQLWTSGSGRVNPYSARQCNHWKTGDKIKLGATATPAPGKSVTVSGTFSCGKYFKSTASQWNALLGSGWKSGVKQLTVTRNGAVVRSGSIQLWTSGSGRVHPYSARQCNHWKTGDVITLKSAGGGGGTPQGVTTTGTIDCGKYFKSDPNKWKTALGGSIVSKVYTMKVYRNGALVRTGPTQLWTSGTGRVSPYSARQCNHWKVGDVLQVVTAGRRVEVTLEDEDFLSEEEMLLELENEEVEF